MARRPFSDPQRTLGVIYIDMDAATLLTDNEVEALQRRMDSIIDQLDALDEELTQVVHRLNASGEAKLKQ